MSTPASGGWLLAVISALLLTGCGGTNKGGPYAYIYIDQAGHLTVSSCHYRSRAEVYEDAPIGAVAYRMCDRGKDGWYRWACCVDWKANAAGQITFSGWHRQKPKPSIFTSTVKVRS